MGFYDGPEGKARWQRALREAAMVEYLFPGTDNVLREFYHLDPLTATKEQLKWKRDAVRAVAQALQLGEDALEARIRADMATFVAAAAMLARSPTQQQLQIHFDRPSATGGLVEALLA